MGKTEHRIVYKAGVTRRPSDFLCQDGELAECINMATDGEELKTVPPLETLFTFPPMPEHEESALPPYITRITRKLLFVHKYNGQERYVIWQQTELEGQATERDIRWGTVEDGQYVPAQEYFPPTTVGGLNLPGFYQDYILFDDPGTATVTCIGKTLIFTTDKGLRYAIWKDDAYEYYDKLPEIKFEAWLDLDLVMSTMGDATGIIESDDTVNESNRHTYEDFVVGLFAESKKKIAKNNGFSEPFFAMVALEMYDGTYTMMSNPILLPVAVTHYYYAQMWQYGTYMYMHYSFLNIAQRQDFRKFSDIVKGVTVFITQGVSFYDTTTILEPADQGASLAVDGLMADGIRYYSPEERSKYQRVVHNDEHIYKRPIKRREQKDIDSSIKGLSVFYKLCDIGLSPVQGGIGIWTEENTVLNLTTQPQLKYNDYFSHAPLSASFSYAYNGRLNIAGIHRGFFPGFSYFTAWSKSEDTYEAYVRINTDSGRKVVKHRYQANTRQDLWFYYPDPRAEWVTIYRYFPPVEHMEQEEEVWVRILDNRLTEHPSLNGAYYFHGLPIDILTHPNEGDYLVGDPTSDTIPQQDDFEEPLPEFLPNQIATSEVNNPFVFLARGYNTVGTGRIIGMATQTHALSPGQYGYAPLIVFTDEGLWAMSVDKTGLYNNVDPMPREVCINPRSIIQTDDYVLFVSKKGLMVIKGRDVSCVSTAMDGRAFDTQTVDCLNAETLRDDERSEPWAQLVGFAADEGMSFQTFLSSALVAYDYIDRRVLLLHPSMSYCWAWSMQDGGFTKIMLPARITNVVSNYPDYILQDGDVNGRTFALYDKTREEDITERSYGFLLTRPLKLSGPVGVSSLRELVNVGCWDKGGGSVVKSQVLVSDDLQRWHLAGSRFGAAAKYFRIALFVYMLPSERLSGTIVREQERRSDNARA